jgi:hypothetical protein
MLTGQQAAAIAEFLRIAVTTQNSVLAVAKAVVVLLKLQ